MGNLQEELKRFNAINKYAEKLIFEQEVPDPNAPADPNALPPAPGGDPNAVPDPNADPNAVDPNADPNAVDPNAETPETPIEPSADDTTEEIDMTDLVNMTKSIKKQLDDTKTDDSGITQKMDDVFSKLNDLESKLGEMNSVISKIDQLGAQIQQIKPKTPIEKLEMRSLDSYPFNKKPDEFFAEKQQEMVKSGKNEYTLTKDDVENYGKYDMLKSFSPDSNYNY